MITSKNFSLSLIFWTVLLLSAANADDCQINKPNASGVQIDGGPALSNGTTVFRAADAVDDYYLLFNGEDIGIVSKNYIKCAPSKADVKYPVILSSDQLASLGISISEQPEPWIQCPTKSCTGFMISPERVKKLKSTKTDLKSFCLASQVAGLKYDPVSGERLPTFIVEEWLPETDEYALSIPPCLKNEKVISSSDESIMHFSTCKIAYNPFTGRKITDADREILTERGIFTGGGCGGAPSESSLQSIRDKGTLRPAELEALKSELLK